jgi:cytokinin riboside 5'-monophosphate phosphoribohydrolase
MNITVFSSSSDAVDPQFFRVADELGRMIGARGYSLVYGGTNIGLMGAVAKAAYESGARVIGVIPRHIADRGIAFEEAHELIFTRDLRERKAVMETQADAFVVLPGGFGTLEETVEIITLKQLHRHEKAVLLLNAHGFYDPLLALFEHFFEQRFAKTASRALYHFAPTVQEAFAYLDAYQPVPIPSKWDESGDK